jgi:hypothetical protein
LDRFLIVGAGLSGLSLAKFLNGVLIEKGRVGGFFLNDDYPVGGVRGSRLVEEFREASVVRGAAFEASEEGVYILSEEGSKFIKGFVIGANGFREKTAVELGIFGFRPSGIFPLYSAWELVNRGYGIGERVVIYGLNHYSLSLASKLRASVTFVRGSGSLVHSEGEAMDMGFDVVGAKVKWVEGKARLERLRTDEGELRADALILAELSPWNPLNLEYRVGNSAMIFEDPSKIVEGAKILSESLLSGGKWVEVISEAPCFPREVSSEVGKVIVGVREGTRLRLGDREIVAEEPYPVVELPVCDRVRLEVMGCME